MARVGRLAGAILAQTENRYFLVGDLKNPCDFAAAGFHPPGEIEALMRPYVEMAAVRRVEIAEPCLEMNVEGKTLVALLVRLFVIERNGSVSDRLWRLVMQPAGLDQEPPVRGVIDGRWLAQMPESVWEIVRQAVLKCS